MLTDHEKLSELLDQTGTIEKMYVSCKKYSEFIEKRLRDIKQMQETVRQLEERDWIRHVPTTSVVTAEPLIQYQEAAQEFMRVFSFNKLEERDWNMIVAKYDKEELPKNALTLSKLYRIQFSMAQELARLQKE